MQDRDPYQIQTLGRAHTLRLLAEEGVIELKACELQYVITAEERIRGGRDLPEKQCAVIDKLHENQYKPKKMKGKLKEIENARRQRSIGHVEGYGDDSVRPVDNDGT